MNPLHRLFARNQRPQPARRPTVKPALETLETRLAPIASPFELSTVAGQLGAAGFVVNGAAAGDTANGISKAGDVNGDGFADLVIGAYQADPNGNASGRAYVVFGRPDGFGGSLDLSAMAAGSGG